MDSLYTKRNEITALAIGNSGCRAIDFETLGLKGYNLWKGGTDLFETDKMARIAVPELPNLKTIFIPVAFFSFVQDNGKIQTRQDLRVRYYVILQSVGYWGLINDDFRNFVLGVLAPLARGDHWKAVFGNLLFGESEKVKQMHAIDKYGNIGRKRYDGITPEKIGKWASIHIALVNEITRNYPDVGEEVLKSFKKSVKFLKKQKGLRVIYFIPPIYQSYTKIIEKRKGEYIDRAIDIMRGIEKEYNVEFYDHSFDQDFVNDPNLFFDENHLNEQGGKLFSAKFKKELGL